MFGTTVLLELQSFSKAPFAVLQYNDLYLQVRMLLKVIKSEDMSYQTIKDVLEINIVISCSSLAN